MSAVPKRRVVRILTLFLVAGGAGLILKAVPGHHSSADLTNSIGMPFRLIPAGEFLMGAPATDTLAEPDERPQHRVIISRSFLMAQFEVTQAQFERVMGYNPSWFRPGRRGAAQLPGSMSADQLPVESVSWQEAFEFCERLSSRAEEVAAGRTYRLPTEAEWEYACRAGSTTRFHFGDRFDAGLANMDQSRSHPLPCGSFPANSFGLYDMHGNVLEWCHDWHRPDYYADSPVVDPQGPELADGDHHVLRGGGWAFPAASAAFRDRIPSHFKSPSHGFRVVCEVATETF